MGNCHPEKNVDWGKAEVDIGFSHGDNFPCYPLVQSIFIILYWMLIKWLYIVYITFGLQTI